MRLFIAIALPDEVRMLLAGAAERLAASGAPVKWVAPESLHLTVKFLGEADAARGAALEAALRRAAAGIFPFEARIRGAGTYPSARRPRVVWAGLEAPPDLAQLVASVERHVSPEGFPTEERPWSPHVTLGRVKDEKGRRRPRERAPGESASLAVLLERERGLVSAPFWITGLTLFASILGHRAPTYVSQAEVALDR